MSERVFNSPSPIPIETVPDETEERELQETQEELEEEVDDLDIVPDINNKAAPRPVLGAPQISEAAVRQRAARIFKPRCDGSLKVSEKIFKEWKNKGRDRRRLEQIFKQCGYDADPCWQNSSINVYLLPFDLFAPSLGRKFSWRRWK